MDGDKGTRLCPPFQEIQIGRRETRQTLAPARLKSTFPRSASASAARLTAGDAWCRLRFQGQKTINTSPVVVTVCRQLDGSPAAMRLERQLWFDECSPRWAGA